MGLLFGGWCLDTSSPQVGEDKGGMLNSWAEKKIDPAADKVGSCQLCENHEVDAFPRLPSHLVQGGYQLRRDAKFGGGEGTEIFADFLSSK